MEGAIRGRCTDHTRPKTRANVRKRRLHGRGGVPFEFGGSRGPAGLTIGRPDAVQPASLAGGEAMSALVGSERSGDARCRKDSSPEVHLPEHLAGRAREGA